MGPAPAMAASGAGWVRAAMAPSRPSACTGRPRWPRRRPCWPIWGRPRWRWPAGSTPSPRCATARAVTDLVSLAAIPELAEISTSDGRLQIGAGVTHHRIETEPAISAARPDLAAAWRTIGNIRVRMAGTLGGNLLAGNPLYDAPVLLTAAGASLVFVSAGGERTVDLDGDPPWPPADGALLTKAAVPLGGQTLLFDRSLKPAVSVALAHKRTADGAVRVRAAVGCAFAAPVAADLDPGALADPAGAAASFARRLPDPIDDAIAGAPYRRKMAGVLLRRLLQHLADGGAGS